MLSFVLDIAYADGMSLSERPYEIVQLCIKETDKNGPEYATVFDEKPLAWEVEHCPLRRLYIRAAVHFLKLNLFEV